MRAEIIAVGTELLMGQIVNTNAQYIAQGLTEIGVGVYFQTVVGDNAGRIKEAFQIASKRADLVLVTGGLGPTQDDLTKDVLAEYIGQKLIIHQPSMDTIEQLFSKRGTPMAPSNARQALLPEHAVPFQNDTGLAVGAGVTYENTHFVLLPGPPKEMKPMFDRYVKPWIASKQTGVQPLFSVMLKFAGIGESQLEHELLDLIKAQTDPTIAPYAKEGEVAVRLTTRAASASEAEAKLAPVKAEIESRMKEHLYADEDIAMEELLVKLLTKRGERVSSAESCTGGLFGELITAVPGSSAVYAGGIISYTNSMKHKLLGVSETLLEGPGAPGAVSEETAVKMAEGALAITGSDYAIAITGVAGPAPSEEKPVGLVFVSVARRKDGDVRTYRFQFSGTREGIRIRAVKQAQYRLWRMIAEEEGSVL